MNFGRPKHADRQAAVEQYSFSGNLVAPISERAVVRQVTGRQRRLRLGDRRVETGRLRRVRVVTVRVDVDGFAGDHHRRGRVSGQRQQGLGVRLREAHAVDQKVRPGPESRCQHRRIISVRSQKPSASRGQISGQMLPVSADHIDLPTAGQEPPAHRLTHHTSTADHECPHPGTIATTTGKTAKALPLVGRCDP